MRPVHRYVAVVTAAGLVVLASILAFADLSPLRHPDAQLLVFATLLILGELVAIKVPRRGEQGDEITTSTTFAYALVIHAGTAPALLAQAIACIVSDVRRHKAPWKIAFNLAQYSIALAACGYTLSLLSNIPHHGGSFSATELPVIVLAGGIFFFLNNALVGVGLALAQGEQVAGYIRHDLGFQAAPASVLLALAPVVAYLGVHSLLFLPLLAMPMVAVYRSAQASLNYSRSERRFRSLVQNSADVVAILDRTGRVQYISPSVEAALGHAPERLLGTLLFGIIQPEDITRVQMAMDEALRSPGRTIKSEFRCLGADGAWRQLEAMWSDLIDDPSVKGIVVNCRDITERKELEDQLAHQAFHDSLTGLANRALFENRVEHALARARRTRRPVSVLFLDLDNFKTVNDSLGHAAGDELLVAAAERLRGCLRPADTPSRLGGDEFGIVFEDATEVEQACRVAERILAALRNPFHVRGRDVFLTASVGIAMSADGTEGADELLRNADVAMYTSKAAGKGRVEVFRPNMHEAVLHRLELGADLRAAVERGEFGVLYQPIVDLRSKQITGVEALLRWNHPQRGLVGPMEFIVLAEETGLVLELGRWVLEESCRQAAEWFRRFPGRAPETVSVNLSPRQLQEPDLVEVVAAALAKSGLEPHHLVLEITETVMMRDVEATVGTLHALKELGVRIAIDDFGTGYSSLSYLRDLPIDIMKIDKAFVDGVEAGSQGAALARAIVGLGRTLNLTTVAEGIEHAQQVDQLRSMGCDLGQGFLFARPMGRNDIARLLRHGIEAASIEVLPGGLEHADRVSARAAAVTA
jgi:diguanylate cyclase (GGDEF)-like protein/PAS domain S-box-containing protein